MYIHIRFLLKNKPHMKNTKNNTLILFPVMFAFFIMGFVDVVGISANYIKQDFGLSDTLANFIPMMVFIWFAVFSIPTGLLMDRIGRKSTVLISLGITAVAMLLPLFAYDFEAMLVAFALLGIGNTMLQVALNPLVSAIVSGEKLTSSLTLGQFIKAIASFLGPILATSCATFFGNWKLIFLVYFAITILSTLWLFFSPLKKEEKQAKTNTTTFSSSLSLLKKSYILSMFFGILLIVGLDVGLNIVIPQLLIQKINLPLESAGLGTSLYFAARTIGAFAGALLLARILPARFMQTTMIIGLAAFGVMLFSDSLWLICTMVFIIGLCCSNVFSILFASALHSEPEHTNEVSALMIMGVSGGALITPIMGKLSDLYGLTASLSLLMLCLAYLLFISYKLKK